MQLCHLVTSNPPGSCLQHIKAVLLTDADFGWSYSEIDPDVFGEALDQSAYSHVDRIAAIGLAVSRKSGASDAG